MNEIIVEIKFGEGGEDSKLFVKDLASAYIKYAENHNCKIKILSESHGEIILRISGKNVDKLFQNESGKHCVQRVPPTESRGRKQTSTITVAILPIEDNTIILSEKDFDVETSVGSGPGGQHRNRTASTVKMTYKPLGLSVKIDKRNQHANRREASRLLKARIGEHITKRKRKDRKAKRKQQVGDGGRGNKTRTYNFMESRVVDHKLKTKTHNIKKIMRGHFELLWK